MTLDIVGAERQKGKEMATFDLDPLSLSLASISWLTSLILLPASFVLCPLSFGLSSRLTRVLVCASGCKDFQLVTWSRDQTLRIWRLDPQLQKVDLRPLAEQAAAAAVPTSHARCRCGAAAVRQRPGGPADGRRVCRRRRDGQVARVRRFGGTARQSRRGASSARWRTPRSSHSSHSSRSSRPGMGEGKAQRHSSPWFDRHRPRAGYSRRGAV